MVKHTVPPACRSWPGVISFSTTVPSIGARIAAGTFPTAPPAVSDAIVALSTPSDRSCWSAASRSAQRRQCVGARLVHVATGNRIRSSTVPRPARARDLACSAVALRLSKGRHRLREVG